jgi:lipopolysaccharide/colanic/teichoic acid biosynthesis glycosyltransferase
MLLIALAVRLNMGSPVLFRQRRPGLNEDLFDILKFRTMVDGGNAPDAERLTALGRFLRSTSLDELPELFNVLRGDMSLVGPRPLLTKYLSLYNPEQARRHDVKPGITGWAQIHGRNALVWEEKLEADVWYVDHWSLWLDIRILWSTLFQVIRREGISAEGHVTMPEFRGSLE